ncbi:MAG TPA: ATP F0F1 synthase subunit B [Xanthobacteraceae bacterium]|nr:ATP F0F1 synthase subunit B [Xanthobacteraceae bacterium]
MIEFIYEPETWVAIAFAIFVGILIKLGAPNLLFKALDDRSARIKAELDDALRLRREAEGVLAEYRSRQSEAERAAESIILNARSEAERLTVEAKAKVEEFIARRTKMAETKIAQAEAQALADVRSAAADAAVAAAEEILVKTMHGPAAEALVTRGISDLKDKLN